MTQQVLFNHFTAGTFDYATLSTFTGELPTATGFTPHGTNDTLSVTDGVLSAAVPYQPVGFPYTDIEFCGGVLHVVVRHAP